MQDRPDSDQCGVLLEDLMGGDGIVLGTWTSKLGREGQELALAQLCEHRPSGISSELPSSASAALLWVWCLGGILEHWNGFFFKILFLTFTNGKQK